MSRGGTQKAKSARELKRAQAARQVLSKTEANRQLQATRQYVFELNAEMREWAFRARKAERALAETRKLFDEDGEEK